MIKKPLSRLLPISVLLILPLPSILLAASIQLSWQPNTEPDLRGYHIYFGTQPRDYGPPIPVERTTSYTLAGLEKNTLYYFAVTAVDNNGNESGFSAEISKSINVTDTTAPDVAITSPADADLYATNNPMMGLAGSAADDGDLQQISWTSSSGAGGMATGTESWSVDAIDLMEGDNLLTVTATDSAGNSAQDTITVIYTPVGEPEGLTVVSVSASTHDGNVAENTLDNNLSTRWSADGDRPWIQYDLGGHYRIAEVAIAFYRGDARRADFEILVSDDASAWHSVFRGQSSGISLQPEKYPLTGARGRFVRIVGYGNTSNAWNSITEVEIFGAASTPPDIRASTVEIASPTTSRSHYAFQTRFQSAAERPRGLRDKI